MEKHSAQPKLHQLPSISEGLTKKQIAELAEQSVESVMEEGNVFEVAEALAAMEEFVKAVRKNERYIQLVRDELSKYNGRMFTSSGAKIESCEAGVSYDYTSNGEWRMLEEKIRELQQQKKEVEERLKKLAPGRMQVDTETGEVIEGANRNSKSTYRITLSR